MEKKEEKVQNDLQLRINSLVFEALSIVEDLAKTTGRDQNAILLLNQVYENIHALRSGGRKTKPKVARLLGAGYVKFMREELENVDRNQQTNK